MWCKAWTKRSTTSKQTPERNLNASNAVVVDSLTGRAGVVVHDLGERRRRPEPHARRRANARVQCRECPVSLRRQLSLAAPNADVDGLIYLLRDNLQRADAFVSTAEEQIERSWGGGGDEGSDGNGDDDVLRRRNQVEYLVEAARLPVRAAICTGEELDVEWSRHRTGLHEHRRRT